MDLLLVVAHHLGVGPNQNGNASGTGSNFVGFPNCPPVGLADSSSLPLLFVTGAFWPDGLTFTRPCKIFQAKVFIE